MRRIIAAFAALGLAVAAAPAMASDHPCHHGDQSQQQSEHYKNGESYKPPSDYKPPQENTTPPSPSLVPPPAPSPAPNTNSSNSTASQTVNVTTVTNVTNVTNVTVSQSASKVQPKHTYHSKPKPRHRCKCIHRKPKPSKICHSGSTGFVCGTNSHPVGKG